MYSNGVGNSLFFFFFYCNFSNYLHKVSTKCLLKRHEPSHPIPYIKAWSKLRTNWRQCRKKKLIQEDPRYFVIMNLTLTQRLLSSFGFFFRRIGQMSSDFLYTFSDFFFPEENWGAPAACFQSLFFEWPAWLTCASLPEPLPCEVLQQKWMKNCHSIPWRALEVPGDFLYLLWEQNTKQSLSNASVRGSRIDMPSLRSKPSGIQLEGFILVTSKTLLKHSCSSETFHLWCSGIFG